LADDRPKDWWNLEGVSQRPQTCLPVYETGRWQAKRLV